MLGFPHSAMRAAGTLVFALLAAKLGAQEYRFQFLGVEQGLTNLAVKTIYQDRKGFLWVSTENGIFRYDGARFQAFGREEGIPVMAGASFGEAPDGSLLAGSDGGLYRLTGSRFEEIPLPGNSPVSWIGGVKTDGNGHTYLATGKGLMVLTGQPSDKAFSIREVTVPAEIAGSPARAIVVEKESVWYGCGEEVCRLSGGKVSVYGLKAGLPLAAWSPIGRANGDLWLRSGGTGVAVLPAGSSIFELCASPLPRNGLAGTPEVDVSGFVLFPSPDGLMIRGKDEWRKIGRAAGLRGAVYSVMQDREGSLWIGMAGRGLVRWPGYQNWEAYTADSGLGSDLAYEILPQPGGKLWVGTESGLALGTKQGEGYSWRRMAQIGNVPVHSVKADPEGVLWIGTETRAVARLNPVSGVAEWIGPEQGLEAKSAYAVRIDRNRRIWAATENGLFVAELPFRRFRPVEGLPRTRFWAISESANGDIWAGGKDGLFHLAGTALERFTTKNGLSNQEVLSLGAAGNGDVWVGYRFGGEVDRLSPAGGTTNVTHVTHKQPNGNGLVYFLGFDARDRLWAGTERGVDVLEEGHWTHLDTNDGLVWDDCDLNGFASEADGTVWIGTSGGLARYSPRPRAATVFQSAVVFTKLKLGKKDAAPDEHPSVDYESNQLVARFSALNFTHANGLSFRYRLSPLFTDWRTTSGSELEFPGLPSGSYRLEIQVRDKRGTWSAETAAFSFDVRPAWFRTWWFIWICLVLPVVLGAVGIRLRIKSMKRREEELLELVELRTADLREANEGLRQLSSIDGLTGVANRRTLDQTLEREWARMMRSGEPLSLLLLDVDHFKVLNDSEGHQRGDECLILVAAEARRLVKREVDLVARYGGEEFAIVLASTGAEDAASIAEGLRLAIAGLSLRNRDSPVAPVVTVSIGVATAVRGAYTDVSEFVAAADRGLYAAKHAGRNRVVGGYFRLAGLALP